MREENAEVYSEPCQTSKIEDFAKIVNGLSECLNLLENASKPLEKLAQHVNL